MNKAILTSFLCAFFARAACFLILPMTQDYLYFLGSARQSYWYFFYEYMAHGLWVLSAGIVPIYVFFHLIIYSAIAPVIWLLCKNELKLSPRVCALAVLGVSFLPYFVFACLKQPNFSVSLTVCVFWIWMTLKWVRSRSFLWVDIAYGILSFLFIYARSNVLIVLFFVFGFFLLFKNIVVDNFGLRLKKIIVSGGVVTGLLLLTSFVQSLSSGHFTPFPPLAGFNMYVGNNPYVVEYAKKYIGSGYLEVLYHEKGVPNHIDLMTDSYARDKALMTVAIAYIKAHPFKTLEHMAWKAKRYWDFRLDDAYTSPLYVNILFSIPYIIYFLFALYAAFLMMRKKIQYDGYMHLLLFVLIMSYFLPHIVFQGAIRNRMLMESVLLIWAAMGAGYLLEKCRGYLK